MRLSRAPTIIYGLLLLLAATGKGKRFMEVTPGRRRLAAASAPAVPLESTCQQPEYISLEPTADAIFDQLTPQEHIDVAQFLVNEMDFTFIADTNQAAAPADVDNTIAQVLNASLPSGAASQWRGNVIYNIFLMPPDKAAALNYLDNGGPAPARYANAIVLRGALEVPDVMEYMVGPLPIGPETTAMQMRADGEIAWNKRPSSDRGERTAWEGLMNRTNAALTPLFLAVTGQCLDGADARCENNSLSQWSQPAWNREDGENRIKIFWHFLAPHFGGSGDELFAIPIYFKLDVSDLDPANWFAFDFEHCTQYASTAEALVAALNDGSLKVCDATLWTQPNYVSTWADDTPKGLGRAGANIPGPRLYEPAGKRFQLMNGGSPTSRSFSWMGWEGHVSNEPWRGLRLHNIKFKGERILYELALQDQFVAYSGYQSIGQSYYFDGTYNLGGRSVTLRPGYDCPETATYMDVNVMGEWGLLKHYTGGVCFFEDYMATTTWRHFDAAEEDINTSRDRGVRSYDNYDYSYDIRLCMDGEIRVTVTMAGYMQNAYYDDQHKLTERDLVFGTRTHEKTLSNIHDHLTSWKIDFDINGTANNFHKTVLRAGTYDEIFDPGSTPQYANPETEYKYADNKIVETEQGWKLNFLEPSIYTVANDKVKNEWGNSRSYGIFHQYSAPQLLSDRSALLQAAAWSKYNIAVSSRKENESYSCTDYFDAHNPSNPVTSIDKVVDGEPVTEDDVVVWLSMGIIHVPRGEDVPLITNVGSEFQLKPINFFTELASLDIIESDDFEPCMPKQGNSFDYTWSGQGNNFMYDKTSFTLANPLPQPEPVPNTVSTSSVAG